MSSVICIAENFSQIHRFKCFDNMYMYCVMHRGVKLQKHAMKIVEKVLDKRFRKIITIDDSDLFLLSVQLMQSLFQGECKKLS